MDRLDVLINRLRRYTHTHRYSDAVSLSSQRGIQTQTFIDLANEAQNVVRGIAHRSGGDLYTTQTTIDLVASQEAYTLPADAFLGVNVVSVEYLVDTTTKYRKIPYKSIHLRNTSVTGVPQSYVHRSNQILVNPIPIASKTNGLRVTYEYKFPDLDIRRGAITAVDDGDAPTSITIATSTSADVAFSGDLKAEYLTVVDKYGTRIMTKIPLSSYDTSTGVLTLDSFTPDSGSGTITTDHYVVAGYNATSHSVLPDFCEAYITEFMKHGVLSILKDPELVASERKLGALEVQLMESFCLYNADIQNIEILDPDRYLPGLDGGYFYGI